MHATAKMASHTPHNADATAALVVPSFTQSRTYTYESEDGTANSVDDSMASESMASASTTNTANMSSPGAANGQYSSKSARYKSAMAPARHLHMCLPPRTNSLRP